MSNNSNTIVSEFLNPSLTTLGTSLPDTIINSPVFKRDKFTWLSYGLMGYYSYLLAILGPVIAFLVIEFGLDYTTSSLHFSAFALGMFIAGAGGDRVNKVVGRSVTLWGGTIGMGLGTLLLLLSNNAIYSISGVFLMGLLGSLLLVSVQSGLADLHGEKRGLALTEANIIASIGSSLSAWVIGLVANTAFGWRASLWLVMPLVLTLIIFFRQKVPIPSLPVPLPHRHEQQRVVVSSRSSSSKSPSFFSFFSSFSKLEKKRRKLPAIFWLFWAIGFLAVSTEWCIGFWSIDFLTKVNGLSKSDAAMVMGLYFVTFVLSRIVSSRLIRTLPASTLLPLSAILILAGFPVFWLVSNPVVSVGGLLIVGLGTANLVPLNLAAAIGIASSYTDLASARLTSASGLALLISPFVLGWLATQLGIQLAFGFIMALALVMFTLMLVGYFKSKQR